MSSSQAAPTQAELIAQDWNWFSNGPSHGRDAVLVASHYQVSEIVDAFEKSPEEKRKAVITEKSAKIMDKLMHDIGELVSECTFLELPHKDSLADLMETLKLIQSIHNARVAADYPAYRQNWDLFSALLMKQFKKRGLEC
jgi:hypothetical protein